MSNWRYNYFETQILLPETIQWEIGTLIKSLKNWFYLNLKLFSKVHTVYCTWLQIRVQHWGMISIFWWPFWNGGGDDFKISCLGEFFGIPKLMFFYSFPPNFFDDLFFLLASLFPMSCSNSLIPKKIPPPCILRPPKYFLLEPSLKNIGACWTMGKNQNYWGDGGQILGGMNLPIPPGFTALIL